MPQPLSRRARYRAGAVCLLGVVAAGAAVARFRPDAVPPAPLPPLAPTVGYDLDVRCPPLVPPGTVVGSTPPPGWSHLIIKSQPRLRPEDEKEADSLVARNTRLIFSVVLADVRPEPDLSPSRYRLREVAVGVGTAIDGRDTVVSPDTHRQLGAKLGFIGPLILNGWYAGIQRSRLVLRGPTLALLDMPTITWRGDEHRSVDLRYALVVDEASGRLDVLHWVIDRSGRPGSEVPAEPMLEHLPPSKLEDALVHVDYRKFTLGVPTEEAFASVRTPRGDAQVHCPSELFRCACDERFTPAAARAVERGLRSLLRR